MLHQDYPPFSRSSLATLAASIDHVEARAISIFHWLPTFVSHFLNLTPIAWEILPLYLPLWLS